VVYEVAVPNGLKQAIGKTKGENILRGFFAEKMVDPENPLLLEHLVQFAVQ